MNLILEILLAICLFISMASMYSYEKKGNMISVVSTGFTSLLLAMMFISI